MKMTKPLFTMVYGRVSRMTNGVLIFIRRSWKLWIIWRGFRNLLRVYGIRGISLRLMILLICQGYRFRLYIRGIRRITSFISLFRKYLERFLLKIIWKLLFSLWRISMIGCLNISRGKCSCIMICFSIMRGIFNKQTENNFNSISSYKWKEVIYLGIFSISKRYVKTVS